MKAFVRLLSSALVMFALMSSSQAGWGNWQYMNKSAVRVIDGDTIAYRGVPIRIVGLEAPEVWRPRCAAEKQAGLESKQYAQQWVASAKVITVQFRYVQNRQSDKMKRDHDKYGRSLANVQIDGKDWTDTMIGAGHAKLWPTGGPTPSWC